MADVLELCQAILRLGPEEEVDFHAEKEMKRALLEYRAAPKKALAHARFMFNGIEHESMLEALTRHESIQVAGIRFVRPDLQENWDYNTPTRAIALVGQGMGWLERFSYDSFSLEKWHRDQHLQRENVMLRAYVSRFYYPQSIRTKSVDPLAGPRRAYVPRLMLLEELWSEVRRTGLVPFEIRLCAYTRQTRYAYDLDLVHSVMLKDFRGGQAPLRGRVERSAMDYLNFDTVLASTDMKDLVKRTFINLFEVESATAFDIAHSMHITDQMAKNALDAIVSRGLASKEGHTPRETYSIDPEHLARVAGDME